MSDRNGDSYTVNNNYFGDATPPLLKTPKVTPRRVAEDQLVNLQRQFARPPGINEAYDVLVGEHTVIVHGEPGSGRSSAAQVLLCELPHDGGTYHELTPEKPETPSVRWLSLDLIGERDRMLLDLSSADDRTWHAVHSELSGFRHEVLRKGAFLAIVLPQEFKEQLSPQFLQFSRKIDRPDTWEAGNRHLWLAEVEGNVRDLAPSALRTYLDTAPPMRDLARLAERIAAARGDGDFAAWCEAALAAQTDLTTDVAEALRRVRKGRERALLLTAAMLDGARAEVVHRATNLLVEAAGSAHDGRPLLEHKGLSVRLETVGAELGSDSRVRFTQPHFAETARHHFWANLPDVREPLSTWLKQALRLRDLDETDRANLVARFTDLCLSTGEFERLTALVEQWTQDSAHRASEVRAAAHVLQRGVEDEQLDAAFRSKIYTWSSTGRPSKHLREVLVEVCTKVMSVHHPEPALVRLHHLARNEPHPSVVARRALLEYVSQDVRLLRRLLARLATAQSEPHRRADADLFLDLAGFPDHFLLAAPTREWLTTCWRMAFELLTPQRWTRCTANWLATADQVDGEALVEAALGILVDASDARYPVLSRIYADARRNVSPGLASRLLESINIAQRARFTRPAPDPEVPPS